MEELLRFINGNEELWRLIMSSDTAMRTLIVLSLGFLALILLILRQFTCWFFKINERIHHQKQIIALLEDLNRKEESAAVVTHERVEFSEPIEEPIPEESVPQSTPQQPSPSRASSTRPSQPRYNPLTGRRSR